MNIENIENIEKVIYKQKSCIIKKNVSIFFNFNLFLLLKLKCVENYGISHAWERERDKKKKKTKIYRGNIRELLLAVILREKLSLNYITDLSPALSDYFAIIVIHVMSQLLRKTW